MSNSLKKTSEMAELNALRSIISNAPDGATHYCSKSRFYFLLSNKDDAKTGSSFLFHSRSSGEWESERITDENLHCLSDLKAIVAIMEQKERLHAALIKSTEALERELSQDLDRKYHLADLIVELRDAAVFNSSLDQVREELIPFAPNDANQPTQLAPASLEDVCRIDSSGKNYYPLQLCKHIKAATKDVFDTVNSKQEGLYVQRVNNLFGAGYGNRFFLISGAFTRGVLFTTCPFCGGPLMSKLELDAYREVLIDTIKN